MTPCGVQLMHVSLQLVKVAASRPGIRRNPSRIAKREGTSLPDFIHSIYRGFYDLIHD